MNVFFCFIYVKIKFTFSYSYHSSNLGHVRKYTHKRSSFCYFYFTILHQVATIFVVSSVFFCFLQFGRNFPHFPCVIFLFYIWGGRILFFVKIVLKSLFSVSFVCFFTLEGKKFICSLSSTFVLLLPFLAWNGTQFVRFFCLTFAHFGKVGWLEEEGFHFYATFC